MDSAVCKTKALPAAAGSVYSDAIDLDHGDRGDFLAAVELLITGPELDATALPATKTVTYDVIQHSTSDLSSGSVLAGSVLVQTGDDSVGGADEDTVRVRLPIDVLEFVGVKATTSAGSGDCSGSDLTGQLVF